jgi:hypothetical protein
MDFSAGYMMASFLVSTIGWGFFKYGKKQERMPQMVCGLALMVYPYFVGSVALMYGIMGAAVAGLWVATRLGL